MAEQKTQKLYEEIAAKMLAQIEEGALRPGDRLPPERALAEEYGVSRTAIREALRSLEMMGCVESHVGEGTFIKSPSLQNIVDPFSILLTQNRQLGSELIEVRLILETEGLESIRNYSLGGTGSMTLGDLLQAILNSPEK